MPDPPATRHQLPLARKTCKSVFSHYFPNSHAPRSRKCPANPSQQRLARSAVRSNAVIKKGSAQARFNGPRGGSSVALARPALGTGHKTQTCRSVTLSLKYDTSRALSTPGQHNLASTKKITKYTTFPIEQYTSIPAFTRAIRS